MEASGHLWPEGQSHLPEVEPHLWGGPGYSLGKIKDDSGKD